MKRILFTFVVVVTALNLAIAQTGKVYPVTIKSAEQVYDGDTIQDVMLKVSDDSTAYGEVWPGVYKRPDGIYVKFDLRINGIDTPEIRPSLKSRDGTSRTKASRDAEKNMALQARLIVIDVLKTNSNRFGVENPKLGKYAGRMVADVKVGEINLADYLLQSGLAKPYNGGQKPSWDKSINTARQTSKVTRQHVGQARQESTSSESVYTTGKGKKYHRKGCRYLKRDIKMLTPQKAEKNGYSPCSVCNP